MRHYLRQLGSLGAPFTVYLTGRAVSDVGDQVAPLALAFCAMRYFNNGPAALGLMIASAGVPRLALVLVGGALVDRRPPGMLIALSDACRSIVQTASGLLLLGGYRNLLVLCLLQLVYGAASAFGSPAVLSSPPRLVTSERLQQANALLLSARGFARVVGPLLGGLLATIALPAVGLLLDGASFLFASVTAFLIKELRGDVADTGENNVLKEIGHGIRVFLARRWLVAFTVYFAAYQLVVLPIVYIFGPVVSSRQPMGAAYWGAAMSAAGIGALLAGWWMTIRPKNISVPIVLALSALELPFLLSLALGAGLPLLLPAAAVWGFLAMVWAVFYETLLQSQLPLEVLGRANAIDEIVSTALKPLGYAAVGLLAGIASTQGWFVFASVVFALSTVALAFSPQIRSLSAVTEDNALAYEGPASG